MDIQASKDGTSLVKGISFFSTWFLHAERYFFLCFFFFFRSCFFLIYCKDRTGNEDFTYEGGFKQRMD